MKRHPPYLPISLCLISWMSLSPLDAQEKVRCVQWSYDYNGDQVCLAWDPSDAPQPKSRPADRTGEGYIGPGTGAGTPASEPAGGVEVAGGVGAAVRSLEQRTKLLEHRLKTLATAADFAAAIKSVEGRLTSVENSLGSAAQAESEVKSLEDRLKALPTAADSAAAIESLEGRLTAVENSLRSAAYAEAAVKSLEDRLKTLPTAVDFGEAIESIEGRLTAVENSAGSAARAEAAEKALEDRLKSVEDSVNSSRNRAESTTNAEAAEAKALGDRLNSEVTEALHASLRSVSLRRVDYVCDYTKYHWCSAQCDADEILISGGCFLPHDEAGLISSSWLGAEKNSRRWNCMFADAQPVHPTWPPLTQTAAFAYCARFP